MFTRCGKLLFIVDILILAAVKEIFKTLIKVTPDIIMSVPVSNDSHTTIIDEIANNIKIKLTYDFKRTDFGSQIDERILRGNLALLMA